MTGPKTGGRSPPLWKPLMPLLGKRSKQALQATLDGNVFFRSWVAALQFGEAAARSIHSPKHKRFVQRIARCMSATEYSKRLLRFVFRHAFDSIGKERCWNLHTNS